MRLVNDQMMVFGQHPVFGRGVGHQQGMVHHHHVRGVGLFARPVEKTAPVLFALASIQGTAFVVRAHLAPNETIGGRRQREFALVAGLRIRQPNKYARDRTQLFGAEVRAALQGRETTRTQVIATPLQQRSTEGGLA